MRANVYVDGFNLYYGLVRGTPYRWLDLGKLCRLLLPGDEINRIRYFTARVRSRPDDPGKAQRQQTFLRALETIPNLTVHYGHFLERPVRMALADPPARGPRTVEVLRTEEKGSDVNLATYLLVDGFDRDYELAVIISNDSDLLEPIRVVREKLALRVGVLNPQRTTSHALRQAADFYRPVRLGAIRASQFPDTLRDARGQIRKPSAW
ncbi:MAG TPA: NYN domain-containing protein [Gaiellaceae bacterium]|nr:NYN domain-containing protein [Gaiellaceae bacterium]